MGFLPVILMGAYHCTGRRRAAREWNLKSQDFIKPREMNECDNVRILESVMGLIRQPILRNNHVSLAVSMAFFVFY